SGECKAVRYGTQPERFGRNMFLPFHVSSSDDQCEAMKRRVSQLVIFEKCFEGASFPTVVQLHVGNSRCVEGNRFHPSRGVEELAFGYEKKFGLRINEPLNEPGAGDPVHFDVAARNALHRRSPPAYFAVTFRSSKCVTESAFVHSPTLPPSLNVSSVASIFLAPS